jgi:hypothetical protein
MSTDRDVTRDLRSWLHEDAHEDADRVLGLVLDQIDTTPQRRASWLARRFPIMSTTARLGLVAAAIVLAIVVGIGLAGRLSVGPAPEPTPSSSPSPEALSSPPENLSVAVRYFASNFSVPFTFTVPRSGWTTGATAGPSFDVHTRTGAPYGLSVMTDISVYLDPCHWDTGYIADLASLGTVDGIVAALTALPGFTASAPVATTVGGHAGFAFDLTVPSDASACTDVGKVRLLDVGGPSNHDEFSINAHLRYEVIDVGGTPVLLEHYSFEAASRLAEVQQLVNSITFP